MATSRRRPQPNNVDNNIDSIIVDHTRIQNADQNRNDAIGNPLISQRSFHGPSNNNTDTMETNSRRTTATESTIQEACKFLRILDFPDDLEQIEDKAFCNCWSLRKLRIPPTVHSIGGSAFANCWELRSIELPERIESSSSANNSSAANRTSDWNQYWLKLGLCFHNDSSVAIQDAAFNLCHSLRNIALPQSMEVMDVPVTAFVGCAELKKHYPQEEELMEALKHRFDGLQIHKLCYYQSHYPLETTIRNLEQAIASKRRQRQQKQAKMNCHDQCGGVFGRSQNLFQLPWAGTTLAPRLESFDSVHLDSQQDAFGMTPLHILACSVHQSLDLYRILIDYNPSDLITKDKWGDYPLLYAYQTHAPLDSVLLLLRSQRRIFPDHKIEWVPMMNKMCVNNASVESVQMVFQSHEIVFAKEEESERAKEENRINLRLCIQDRFWFWKLVSFPVLQLLVQYQEENIPNDPFLWDRLVERLTASPHWLKDLSIDKVVFLLQKGTGPRLATLGLKAWKEEVTAKINSVNLSCKHQTFAEKRSYVKSILARLKHFEIREMAALLELAMWNKELNHRKPLVIDEDEQHLDLRQECLVSCGAEVVIANVLPLIGKNPSKLAMQRRSRSIGRARGGRRARRRRIVDYVMNEV